MLVMMMPCIHWKVGRNLRLSQGKTASTEDDMMLLVDKSNEDDVKSSIDRSNEDDIKSLIDRAYEDDKKSLIKWQRGSVWEYSPHNGWLLSSEHWKTTEEVARSRLGPPIYIDLIDMWIAMSKTFLPIILVAFTIWTMLCLSNTQNLAHSLRFCFGYYDYS